MALLTLGSNANSSLSAMLWKRPVATADMATFNAGIKSADAAQLLQPSALSHSGWLTIPGGRGRVCALPGDYVAYDTTTGWPILLSAYAIANGPWTHS